MTSYQPSDTELAHLRRCMDLAHEAAADGDGAFGSVLVAGDGTVLAEDRNREVTTGDPTQHPEIALARYGATHLVPDERADATVFTSGEHCPMCSAAHAWAGLGRIVYVHSAAQLTALRQELGQPASPVRAIPVQEVAPQVSVTGPVPGLDAEMLELHRSILTGTD